MAGGCGCGCWSLFVAVGGVIGWLWLWWLVLFKVLL